MSYIIIDGHKIGLNNPSGICPHLVANRLGKIRRFSGHPKALTVLEHLALCEAMAPSEYKAIMATHDCHEAITGDIPSPIKALCGDGLLALENRIDLDILKDQPHPDNHFMVKIIDTEAMRIEAIDIIGIDDPEFTQLLAVNINMPLVAEPFGSVNGELGEAMREAWFSGGFSWPRIYAQIGRGLVQ